MNDRAYGVADQVVCENDLSCRIEEVSLKGFTVIPAVIPDTELAAWREKIDRFYEIQERQFGRETLTTIGELDVCRSRSE